MSTATRACRQCGRELPTDYGDESCEVCTRTFGPVQRSIAPLLDPGTTIGMDEAPASAADAAPPAELGSVRLGEQVGRGASGAVYRGQDHVLGRAVAVKFLSQLARSGNDARKRFLDEARAAAAVSHPSLVQIYQAGVTGETPYLVMEYVQGTTLSQLLRHTGPLSPTITCAVLEQVASALGELNDRGILHRDVKPSNVLLDQVGNVRVTDLGVALQRTQHIGTLEAAVAGTPAYMAPETFEGRFSARSDVYAVGIMAFELLTGSLPFSGDLEALRRKHRDDPLPVDVLAARGVPAALVEVIERAAHKQQLFRYKTAPDFARAFRAALGVPADAKRAARDLSLLVARCTGAPTPQEPSEGTTTTDPYVTVLERMAQQKRQQHAQAGAVPRDVHDPPQPAGWVPPASWSGAAESPVRAAARFGGRVPCLSCGNDLRGMSPAARCAVCGSAVEPSLDPARTVFARTDWLARVARGHTLAIAGIVLALVAALLNPILIAVVSHIRGAERMPILWRAIAHAHTTAGGMRYEPGDLLFAVETLIAFTFMGWGTWLMTTPRAGWRSAWRGPARWLALLPLGLSILLLLLRLIRLLAAAMGDPLGPARVGLGLPELIAVSNVLFAAPLLLHLGSAARSVPEPRRQRRWRAAAIVATTLAAPAMLAWTLGWRGYQPGWSGRPLWAIATSSVCNLLLFAACVLLPVALLLSRTMFRALAAQQATPVGKDTKPV